MSKDIRVKNVENITKDPVVLCPPAGAEYLVAEGRRLVCLIRHGQTDWNTERRLQGREEVPLNEPGRKQSAECGELFKAALEMGIGFSEVFTSPLGRAKETAEYVCASLGAKKAKEIPLLEERDYGPLSGLTMEERAELRNSGKRYSGIESVKSAACRVKKALVAVSREAGEGAIPVVTHGGVINALYYIITRGKIGTGKNYSENCGISLVAVGRGVTIPLAYGLTGDLFLNYISEYLAAKRHREPVREDE